MDKDTLSRFAGLFPALNAHRAAGDELGRMADKVALQRPDLPQAFVLEQIMKLGTETAYAPGHWAQVCVDRANYRLPLPWESGYHEREYLALLAKHDA